MMPVLFPNVYIQKLVKRKTGKASNIPFFKWKIDKINLYLQDNRILLPTWQDLFHTP